MASPTLISVQTIAVTDSATPSHGVTVPSGATAAYLMLVGYGDSGLAMTGSTLNGVAADASMSLTGTGDGFGVWIREYRSPTIGAQTLALTFNESAHESVAGLFYVSGGVLTGWRDADIGLYTNVTLTSATDDLVLALDSNYGATPANQSGWTSAATQGSGSTNSRARSIIATGSTTAANVQGGSFPTIAAISLEASGGGGGNTITVPLATMTLTGQTPAVTVSNNQRITVPLGTLSLSALTPTVTATANNSIAVPAGTLTLTGLAPSVQVGGNQSISVPLGTLTLSGLTPVVTASDHKTIAVPAGSLTLTGRIPTVTVSANQIVAVPAGSLTVNGFAPTVTATANNLIQVPLGTLTMTAIAPSVQTSGPQIINVPLGVLSITIYAPAVSNGGSSDAVETVPYLLGDTEAAARQRIASIYCTVNMIGTGGTVVSQSPLAFSSTSRNAVITITMGGAIVGILQSKGLLPYSGREAN